jgi:putative endonuclease
MSRLANYRYGIIAEYIAIILLFFKGYAIIKRRYKNYLGEIDIIAAKNNTLVFIEVKARKKSTLWSLTNMQKQRIIMAAKLFMAREKKYQKHNLRFDMVIFEGFMPKHKQNMW